MLWIYLSKSLFALEIKLENFLSKFKTQKMLHLKSVDFETVKNQLTQVNLFGEYSHFMFEEYTGSFTELSSLFEKVSIPANVLMTKSTDTKAYLPQKLMDQMGNSNYWLFEPNYSAKEQYLAELLESLELKLPSKLLEIIKKEALYSNIQLKGVLSQLKLIKDSSKKMTEELVSNLIESNDVVPQLKNKYLFLEWYLSGKIKEWALFLKSLVTKKANSEEVLIEFLSYLTYSLNFHFWNESNDLETQKFMSELGYNFLLFIEKEMFKIKSNSGIGIIYFFWKNSPLTKLKLVI